MPTLYCFPKKSLVRNKVSKRELEIWEKHCTEKKINIKKTPPTKHPLGKNT